MIGPHRNVSVRYSCVTYHPKTQWHKTIGIYYCWVYGFSQRVLLKVELTQAPVVSCGLSSLSISTSREWDLSHIRRSAGWRLAHDGVSSDSWALLPKGSHCPAGCARHMAGAGLQNMHRIDGASWGTGLQLPPLHFTGQSRHQSDIHKGALVDGSHGQDNIAKGTDIGSAKDIQPFFAINPPKQITIRSIMLLKGRKWGIQFIQKPQTQVSSPLWRSLAISSTYIKHTSTLWPSNSIPRYLPKRNKHTCAPQKELYRYTHYGFLHSSQKLEKK